METAISLPSVASDFESSVSRVGNQIDAAFIFARRDFVLPDNCLLLLIVTVLVGKGRSDARVVADHICAVWPIHTLRDVLGAETWLVNITVAGDNVARRIDPDHLVIELIADQRVAIFQADRSGWEGHRVAAWAGISEEVPEVGSGFIGFDDTAIGGVGDEGVPIGEPAGKSHNAERHAAGLCIAVHDSAWRGVRDFKGLVIVLVSDEDVSIFEQFGGVGAVKSVVLPDDGLIGATHLDDATVSLIRDQHMIVVILLRQMGIRHRNVELIEPGASDAERSILPDDVAVRVHKQNAIVDAAIRGRAQRLGATRGSSTRH